MERADCPWGMQDDSRDGGGRECLEHILEVERRWTPKPRKIPCGNKEQVRARHPGEKCGLVLQHSCIDGFSWSVSVHGKTRLAANGHSP